MALRAGTSTAAKFVLRGKSTRASSQLPSAFPAGVDPKASIKPHQLEGYHLKANPGDAPAALRAAVDHRRAMYDVPASIPVDGYPYEKAYMKNCENVIGFMPIPVGICGPMLIDQKQYKVPFATTEGALISSINRGAKALGLSGGVETFIVSFLRASRRACILADFLLHSPGCAGSVRAHKKLMSRHARCVCGRPVSQERVGITRAPILECSDLATLRAVVEWLGANEDTMRTIFEGTTKNGKLIGYHPYVVGTRIHLRINVNSKDAMGMNMITIGSDTLTKHICSLFPGRVACSTLSGNMCTDKKASSINWILGRGFRGVAVCTVPADVLRKVLHCEVEDFCQLNHEKNFVGSAMANTTGGNNSHAANVVAALYLATGQDIAQVGTSAMTLFNATKDGRGDLKLEVLMPSMELATVGGGTSLPAQRGCLELCGAATSEELAKVSLAAVMAGELSLLAAQCAGHLASAHANLGRAAGGAGAEAPPPKAQ